MLRTWLTKPIKALFRAFGLRIAPLNPASCQSTMLAKELQSRGVDTVLDIGANVGQFATALRKAGFRGRIISFEPLSSAHQRLQCLARRDTNWIVHSRGAISDHRGKLTMNISSNSVSSSILDILPAHTGAAPESSVVAHESCDCWSLDELVGQYLADGDRLFIKVDVQGAEWKVLDGARQTLSRTSGLLVEVSFVPLYDGQYLWRAIIDRLAAEGFELWRIDPAFTDLHSGRTLQADCAFFRACR